VTNVGADRGEETHDIAETRDAAPRTYADAGPRSSELVPDATLKTYQGFPQGMPTTQADAISADLLAFVQC